MAYNQYEYGEVLAFCQTCPHLMQLWAMSQELNNGDNSLELTDSTNILSEETEPYTDGRTKLTFTPVYPYHSTYYLSLYRVLYANDNAANTEILSAMSDVCKWFFDAQENGNVPDLSTEKCVKLELLTPRAIRRMTYEDVNGQKIHDFYIAFRIHKINPAKRDVVIV